jgi:hypothetical protein
VGQSSNLAMAPRHVLTALAGRPGYSALHMGHNDKTDTEPCGCVSVVVLHLTARLLHVRAT